MSIATPPRDQALAKVLRFIRIYGPGRTLYKAAGRLRVRLPRLSMSRAPRDVAFAGCGQFAFATIGYFLSRKFGSRVLACYDLDPVAARSLARALDVSIVCDSFEALIRVPGLRLLYVASNHASHAEYAAHALAIGLDVYVEKPVAVSVAQLVRLHDAQATSHGRVFAGYNRPFAAATRRLRELAPIDDREGITLQCFVSGHRIPADHWYRQPDEGTRICGNVGHWLDLMVHVLFWRGLPDAMDIALTWADDAEPDDNVHIAIRTDRSDLLGVTLTSRCEPFEGINESINFQHGETIARIDDFRQLTLWQGSRLHRERFWPKDVGHRAAILQPFGGESRPWREVELSTLLMLHIADMVRARKPVSRFSLKQASTFLADLPPKSA